MPANLVSLTAPKPLVKFYRGRHFIGGRYVDFLFSCFPVRVREVEEREGCWLIGKQTGL
jgi:hypothetical protein